MKQKNERKRVACLYRVSTKKQINGGQEIPLQKIECLNFIEKNLGWELVKEYEEPGISAYKKTTAQRDVLQEALAGARANVFDVLLVFKSDRLCRISDEYNPTVKEFCCNEVEVWSVTEGNLSIVNFDDNLVSYFRGHFNESESRKISDRTDASHRQMVAEGANRGGALCYGYEYFKNGRFGGRDKKERKELFDIRINQAEAEIVRDIFRMYVELGYGGARIAKELNKKGISTRENKRWQGQNINRMLKNPQYNGCDSYFKTSRKKDAKSYCQDKSDWIISPQKLELQIIDDETWQRTEELLLERSSAFQGKSPQYPRKSELLLSGLIRCGHCGHMLRTVPLKRTWKRKDGSIGEKKIYKYRCYYKVSGGDCNGQTEHGKKKIEEVVIKEVYRFMDNLGKFDLTKDHRNKADGEIKSINKECDCIKKKLLEVSKEKDVLEAEIVKALLGNSCFSADQLSSAIRKKEEELSDLNTELAITQSSLNEQKLRIGDVEKVRILSTTFRAAFDEMGNDQKKMVLKELIDNIYVWRDRIEINMKINISHLNEYLNSGDAQGKGGKRTARVIEESISTQLKKK